LLLIFLLDSLFSNNFLDTFSNDTLILDSGLGTISFYGQNLTIEQSIFHNNFNTEGGGVYMDGFSNTYIMNIFFKDVIFENNSVSSNGGAFYLGYGIMNLNGVFESITCRNNTSFSRFFFFNEKSIDL